MMAVLVGCYNFNGATQMTAIETTIEGDELAALYPIRDDDGAKATLAIIELAEGGYSWHVPQWEDYPSTGASMTFTKPKQTP